MIRSALEYLKSQWLDDSARKPLVIRGARQVGKTWLVRELARSTGKQLIELNFEKNPALASYFSSNDPQNILLNLSIFLNQEIDAEHSLLFLDEIQAVPELFSKLRWFYEELPQLCVIAAGSLLEFVLGQHNFSMPVGRITYLYLEPLSFEEFLLSKNEQLYNYLQAYQLSICIPDVIHETLSELFKEYLWVGGMPAAVSSWITEKSFMKVQKIQHDLLATYRDDFAKYAGRIVVEKLDETMMAIPRFVGKKLVYKHINPEITSITYKKILDLLEKSKLAHRIYSTAANGIPLGAEVQKKFFKPLFLDIGLCSAVLGLNINELNTKEDLCFINKGALAEQVAGQILRTLNPLYVEPTLYYWRREENNANAEIDYVIQHGSTIIPVEVKAGSSGTLKSLHFFMGLKKLSMAVRVNSDLPNQTNMHIKDIKLGSIDYTLLSIPFYLIGQMHRFLENNA